MPIRSLVTPTRRAYVRRFGSPIFQHKFGVIAAAGQEQFSIFGTFPAARKYEPLDWLRITNNSPVEVEMFINGITWGIIPAGAIIALDDPGGIWFFRIVNTDAVTATAANDVSVLFRKQSQTADGLARLGE